MPKGVEHTNEPAGFIGTIKVSFPVMPKGVEHARLDEIASGHAGEFSCDAERR